MEHKNEDEKEIKVIDPKESDPTSVASFEADMDIQVIDNEDDIKCFKTSVQPQNRELKAFIEQLLSDPFNHFCLNCKQNPSTHGIVWFGAFICD